MLPHELCTSLRNGVRARLRQVAVPHTHQNLAILSILLRHGFISALSLGAHSQPRSPEAHAMAPAVAQRVWVDLKYRHERPVLGDIQLVSKPSKHIYVSPADVANLMHGRAARFVPPLGLGEIVIIAEYGPGSDTKAATGVRRAAKRPTAFWDGREAVMRGITGELVARVRPE